MISSTSGNTHIGGQYNTNYLTNEVGTQIRSYNGTNHSTIADFFTTGITLSKDVLYDKTSTIYGSAGNTNKRIQLHNKSFINGTGNTRYWKVATLHVSNNGTKDFVELKVTGGLWVTQSGKPELITIKCLFRNRDGFSYNYSIEGNYSSSVRTTNIVRCFNNSSTVDIYVYLTAGYTMFKYDIDGLDCDIITDPQPIASVSGTMIFDSGDASTYPTNQTINVGDIFCDDLKLREGGILEVTKNSKIGLFYVSGLGNNDLIFAMIWIIRHLDGAIHLPQ